MKVAVVTGSNRGLGFAIVERLARELPDWAVYLTARNSERGQAAVEDLASKGVKVNFHQLDITCDQSIENLATYLKEKYGGLDILVNNAGIAYKFASTAPFAEQAEVSMKTNFFGNVNVCKRMFPILRPHARVVHISSMTAFRVLSKLSPELRAKFTSPLSLDGLLSLMNEFVSDAKAGVHREKGWADFCSGTAKVGMTVLAIIQQREFDHDSREDIIVNSCCPGEIMTEMSSYKGDVTTAEGADTPFYLATLPENASSPKGNHVRKREIHEWK